MTICEIAMIICFVIAYIGIINLVEWGIADRYLFDNYVTPNRLYMLTNLNKFGSWFCCIIMRILNPFLPIGLFIKFIFTYEKEK